MKSLGDIIFEGVNRFLCRLIHADKEVESVTELTSSEIDKLIDYYGIKGVILDVDETLRFNMKQVPTENDKWLDMLKDKLKVVVLSNGVDKNIETYLKEKGIIYISFALKPLKKNFIKARELLSLPSSAIAVIGDDILSDIYGGKRNNMVTIKINSKQ